LFSFHDLFSLKEVIQKRLSHISLIINMLFNFE
jgi:hypothetical protein